jgi:hypothetical protein
MAEWRIVIVATVAARTADSRAAGDRGAETDHIAMQHCGARAQEPGVDTHPQLVHLADQLQRGCGCAYIAVIGSTSWASLCCACAMCNRVRIS